MSEQKQKQAKPELTAEQLYKKYQRKSKTLKKLAPVMFWILLSLTVLFFILTISNSLGNLTEIFDLLDKNAYNGEEIAENYARLVEKWGEWTVVGGEGGAFKVVFIDVRRALFSGLMIIFLILTVICLAAAFLIGKIVFPKLSQLYSDNSQDMVNMATLETNAELKKQKTRKEKKEEEWF